MEVASGVVLEARREDAVGVVGEAEDVAEAGEVVVGDAVAGVVAGVGAVVVVDFED